MYNTELLKNKNRENSEIFYMECLSRQYYYYYCIIYWIYFSQKHTAHLHAFAEMHILCIVLECMLCYILGSNQSNL